MRIALVTNAIYAAVPEYVRITDRAKDRYCGLHGIDYLRTSCNPHPDLHPVWCKPSVLLRHMDGYDWLVWMDADAATLGMGFDLAGYLSSVGETVVMQKDINGWNNGVFAVPCTERGRMFMNDVEAHCRDWRYQRGFREQQCMADMFDGEWAGFATEPPLEIGWNSYLPIYSRNNDRNLWQEGHWVLHIPGVRNAATRAELFKEFV